MALTFTLTWAHIDENLDIIVDISLITDTHRF